MGIRTVNSGALQVFQPDPELVYSIEAAARITQVPRRAIAVYCRYGLVSPSSDPRREGWFFNDEGIRRLRHIQRLRTQFGLNLPGLWMIFGLMREVENLREEMRFLRRL